MNRSSASAHLGRIDEPGSASHGGSLGTQAGTLMTRTARFVPSERGNPAPRSDQVNGAPKGRVPRVARLMALAIRFDGLLREGAITTQTDLAAVGHITRARVTQIMNLLHLAPDIQEAILDMQPVLSGRDRITEHELRQIVKTVDWDEQRRQWIELSSGSPRILSRF
jgi:hypothetical protein